MTSDAKIGLLLGLIFIFIIAFLINGLPKFRSDNNNELTTTMFNSQTGDFGFGAKERKAIEQNEPFMGYSPAHLSDESEIRSETPIGKGLSDGKAIMDGKSVGPAQDAPGAKDNKQVSDPPKKAVWPKMYVVAAGDNLSVIAKKFYGDTAGNRFVNVMRIFQANRKALKSADRVYEGQKIMIPPLPAPAMGKKRIEGVFPAAMFEKVKSIGKMRLSIGGPKAKQSGLYVVRDGDSLWRIAAERLGDGLRYVEIANLNADILEDEDSLSVGMQLKIPSQ
jgi:nucleoid-associated protein YgaU